MNTFLAFATLVVVCLFSSNQAAQSLEKQALGETQRTLASELDAELPKLPFDDWFEKAVGPGASVIWQLSECGEPEEVALKQHGDIRACVEANTILPDGRRVIVMISVGTFKKGLAGSPAFHFGVMEQNGELRAIRRLRDLPGLVLEPEKLVKSPPVELPRLNITQVIAPPKNGFVERNSIGNIEELGRFTPIDDPPPAPAPAPAPRPAPLPLYVALFVMSGGFTFAGIGPGAYLASTWFKRKRGVAMGLVGTATSLGGMIFAPISTRLIAGHGWRAAMLAYAGFMFAVFAPLVYFFVKNRPEDIGASADPDESDWFLRRGTLIKSLVASAAIVGALIYSPASSFVINRFGKPSTVMLFMVIGVTCLGVLMKRFAGKGDPAATIAKASPDPASGATMREAMSDRSYWLLLIGSSLSYVVIFTLVQQFILHLRSPLVSFSAADAAWAYSTLFFFSLAGKSLFGFLSDRFEKRAVNLACFVFMLAGALLVLRISHGNVWFFCLLFGLGYGGVTVTTRLVLAELFGLRSLGKLLAIMMSVETLLGGGGNLLAGYLFDTTGSYQAAFKVMSVCSIASVILMMLLGRKPSIRSLNQVG